MSKIKITCLSIDCPERFSNCCHAYCTNGKEGEAHFVCSKCRKEFESPDCEGLTRVRHQLPESKECKHRIGEHGAVVMVGQDKDICVECHKEVEPISRSREDGIDELVRDLTKVGSISKSEVRRRIEDLLNRREK